ncbi:MAG TPA: DEAD/DEAH box helicase, partial [Rhodobacterales bacterium]|nr:DEAD/DEAH box helicase [Rhodobacterales bacterium]
MTTFQDLGLAPKLLAAVEAAGYTRPTPIQLKAIPPVLEGHDVMGLAQTGTGKTAAFGLPL